MPKYIRSARAQEDLADIWHYIAFGNQDAAKNVVNAAYKTFELLAVNPELGNVRRSLQGLRAFPISGYRNYLIVYRVIDDTIEVVRVLHGARNLNSIFDQ